MIQSEILVKILTHIILFKYQYDSLGVFFELKILLKMKSIFWKNPIKVQITIICLVFYYQKVIKFESDLSVMKLIYFPIDQDNGSFNFGFFWCMKDII